MKTITSILIILILTIVCSCKKDISPSTQTSYQWVKLGNKLNYDLITDTGTFPGYRQLEIIMNPGNSNLGFREKNIYDNSLTYPLLLDLDYNVYPKSDGLYCAAYYTCGNGFSLTFEYLRAPKNATLNQLIPIYICEGKVETSYKTIAVDTNIMVPLGTFNTFVLQDTATYNREYWNPDKGLIRLDVYNRQTGNPPKIFVLSKTNY